MQHIISEIKERLSYLKKLEVQVEKSLKENSLEGRIKINGSSKYPPGLFDYKSKRPKRKISGKERQ